jgi:hypothetical protein
MMELHLKKVSAASSLSKRHCLRDYTFAPTEISLSSSLLPSERGECSADAMLVLCLAVLFTVNSVLHYTPALQSVALLLQLRDDGYAMTTPIAILKRTLPQLKSLLNYTIIASSTAQGKPDPFARSFPLFHKHRIPSFLDTVK